ncbi:MAG: hypothetical protein ACI8PZ_007239 [Myxococcota bacterium]|jgi:hypothetical protein
MRALSTFIVLGLSFAAHAAPAFPITLTGGYCGLGPCLPIVATLFEGGTCEVDLLGPCAWRYNRRLAMLEVSFDDGTIWQAERSGTCFVGILESPVLPSPDELNMCAEF